LQDYFKDVLIEEINRGEYVDKHINNITVEKVVEYTE